MTPPLIFVTTAEPHVRGVSTVKIGMPMTRWLRWSLPCFTVFVGCAAEATCQELQNCAIAREDSAADAGSENGKGPDSTDAPQEGLTQVTDAGNDLVITSESSAEGAPSDAATGDSTTIADAVSEPTRDQGTTHDASSESEGSPCGNAVVDTGEQCDNGTAQNVGGYDKCNSDCTLGPRCGDGKVNGPSEVCDNGADNGLAAGACNPACSGTIQQKSIKIYNTFGPHNGNLTNDWDPFCNTQFGLDYKALLVDGVTRVASKSPYAGDGQVDWVLKPYTRYVNAAGSLIWTTDNVALIGVRNGKPAATSGTFGGGGSDFAWAGFETDWTTSTLTCGRWNVSSGGGGTTIGLGFIGAVVTGVSDCANPNFVLCIEQ
jgi:hypothetical protein